MPDPNPTINPGGLLPNSIVAHNKKTKEMQDIQKIPETPNKTPEQPKQSEKPSIFGKNNLER